MRQRTNAGQADGGDSDDDVPEDGDHKEQSGQAEKERLKQQSQPSGKPTDSFQAKGKRKVDDPTTGGKVIISDDAEHAKVRRSSIRVSSLNCKS